MKRTVAALVFSLTTIPAFAAELTLNGEQASELLTGATVKGVHFGAETRQYFSESGLTLWIKEGDKKPSEGRYKIEGAQYCSSWTGLWIKEKYKCYNIAHDKDQNIYYFLADNFRAPL